MTNLRTIILFASLSLTFTSCTKKENTILKVINIDQRRNLNKGLKLSEIIENFKFIHLEEKENSLIGKINKIRVFDEKIFVLDAMSTKSLFVFSKTGKFLYKVGKVGNGPGEFLLPIDFTIDKKNNEIIILDAERNKLHFYSLEGKFKKTKKLDFFGEGLEYDSNKRKIVFKGAGKGNNLVITDINGVEKNSFFPFKKRIEAINPGNLIRVLNDSISLFRLYTRDTIYKVDGTNISPFRLINFKEEDKSSLKSSKGTIKDLAKINNTLKDYIETKQHIWLSYFTRKPKNSYCTLFINKKNNHKRYFNRNDFVNDIFYDNYFLDIATTIDNEYVFVIQPYLVLKTMNKVNLKKIENLKTQSLISKLKETSNPVLMFATLKDF